MASRTGDDSPRQQTVQGLPTKTALRMLAHVSVSPHQNVCWSRSGSVYPDNKGVQQEYHGMAAAFATLTVPQIPDLRVSGSPIRSFSDGCRFVNVRFALPSGSAVFIPPLSLFLDIKGRFNCPHILTHIGSFSSLVAPCAR